MCTVAPHAGGFRRRFVTFTSVTCEIKRKKNPCNKRFVGISTGRRTDSVGVVAEFAVSYFPFLFFQYIIPCE